MSDLRERPATAAGSAVRWPQMAVTAVFVVHGLLFASWTAHIPDVKADLDLTDGTLQGLTHGETRVLHYLPTNLSAREIAGELYLSVNAASASAVTVRRWGRCPASRAAGTSSAAR